MNVDDNEVKAMRIRMKKRIQAVLPAIVAVVLLLGAIGASVLLTGKPQDQPAVNYFESSSGGQAASSGGADSASSQQSAPVSVGEMRAVWVPFMTLDMKGTDYSEQAFRDKFDNIIQKAKACGINTLIVHVRSHGDAMYPSQYFPWSHLLTGTQGKDPGYDPLKYMVEAAHAAGMQFHAWLNPLRIRANGTPSELAAENPYITWRKDEGKENDNWVLDQGEDKYYNPAVPQVRQRIIDGVKEIVQNYAVDAIHFDDYFYPTSEASYDQSSYDAYCAGLAEGAKPLSLLDWRTTNINALITGVYSAIKEVNSQVQFGISPQGNISNDVGMGADVHTWGSIKGYVDYLCPQIYSNFDHPLLPFNETADQWKELVTCQDVKLYFGLAVYKAGSDADEGTWQKANDILKKQIEYGRSLDVDGFMLYSWDYLQTDQTAAEIANVVKLFQ